MSDITKLDRATIEDFLFAEAAFLDEWQLADWLKLFSDDCHYYVPNIGQDPYADPKASLYLISDDAHHLNERIKRLGKRTAHAEFPHSVTQRIVGNIRILERSEDEIRVESKFITHRTRHGITDTYFGRHEYRLVYLAETILIREKRTILRMEALRPHGKLSIIV